MQKFGWQYPADKTASGSKMIHSSDDLDDEAKCFSSSFFVGGGGGGGHTCIAYIREYPRLPPGRQLPLCIVSSFPRVHNSGSLFQANVCSLFWLEFSCCPYYRGVRKARVDCSRWWCCTGDRWQGCQKIWWQQIWRSIFNHSRRREVTTFSKSNFYRL